MMFRTTLCAAALAMGLLVSPSVPAVAACEGAECPAPVKVKPLNIMQFVREQAASTRVAKPRPGKTRAAKVQRPAHRAVAARRKPAPMPVEAAASFASRPAQKDQANVDIVASDEHNAIDRAADAAPAETTGAATVTGPVVQLVDADEINDIDRKADDSPPIPAHTMRATDAPTPPARANTSWLQWIWSALGHTLGALVTAVHQLLIG